MRPTGIHPLALIGEPPEHREYQYGDNHRGVDFDPSARAEAFVTVDGGLEEPTVIGPRTFLMKKVHVGHDAQIGADCEIAPLSSVGGHVRIGDRVKVGQGAVFRPFVVVGEGARIGCGAVVVCDVPAGEVWAGCPAKKIGVCA